MARLVGYQVANKQGENIAGEDNDPSGQPSYYIMAADEAAAVIARAFPERFLLYPIFEGDIEEPEYGPGCGL